MADAVQETMAEARPKFVTRSFVSGLVAFSFAVLAGTGLLMWAEVPLPKHPTLAVHVVTGLLGVAAIGCHVWYNWRTLLGHLRSRVEAGWAARREGLTALALVLLVACGAAAGVPPFSWLVEEEHDGPPRAGMAGERGHDRDGDRD